MKVKLQGCDGWTELVTLDINGDHNPDVVHDLTVLPYPFADDTFHQVHLYDVLEHLGQQGDYRTFFGQFAEFWRILKPGGFLVACSPGPMSRWAWGDPGHTRIMGQECLVFLDQRQYTEQVGKTPITDYRFVYKADFNVAFSDVNSNGQHFYALEAVKPSRIVRPVREAA